MSNSPLASGSPHKLGLMCVLGAGLGLLTIACGNDDATAAKCKAGEVLPCMCETGKPSTRVCAQELFTACRCESLEARDGGGDAAWTTEDAADADTQVVGLMDAEVVDRSCGTQSSTNSVKDERPVDVIFAIDNSGSMSTEIRAIETNINDNFARILDQYGVDYRVILLSHHGGGSTSSTYVCIKAPLSGTSCNPVPAAPVHGPRFFHYDYDVQSQDSLCLLLSTFSTGTSGGWRSWLRPEAFKVFVEVTDDNISCSASYRRDNDAGTASINLSYSAADGGAPVDQGLRIAGQFQDALFAMSPGHFGSKEQPNFSFHSVIGVAANAPANQPYPPSAPVQNGVCAGGENAGHGYQVLSMLTGGLRYPVCDGAGFDSMFLAIARNAVQSSNVECRFAMPEPPVGKYVDEKSIAIEYASSAGKEQLTQVASTDVCDDKSFKVQERDVVLCDQACTRVRKDKSASLQVTYSCGTPPDLK